jgi:hypothetical protein
MLKGSELHSMIESGELTEFKMDKIRVYLHRYDYIIACLICIWALLDAENGSKQVDILYISVKRSYPCV